MSTGISLEERQKVLAQHGQLRALLAVVEDAARRVRTSVPGAMTDLRVVVRDLDAAFRAHLAYEESLLLPRLPPPALNRLRTEHGEQRTMLAALSSDVEIAQKEPVRLADDALWLVDALLKDMQVEDGAIEHDTIDADPTR